MAATVCSSAVALLTPADAAGPSHTTFLGNASSLCSADRVRSASRLAPSSMVVVFRPFCHSNPGTGSLLDSPVQGGSFTGSAKPHIVISEKITECQPGPLPFMCLPDGRQAVVKCNAQNVATVAALSGGTPVRPTSVLVVGATGTLGRQVVRRALDEGYDVRCLVRPRPTPADFLRDWGATVVNGDLDKPETLPAALVGIHTVIDCATGRPEEPIRTVDWDGKVALIQCAKAMGIQKYVFFSIHNCEKHPEVPLMEIKRCTEKYLADSGLNFTILRLCGFMQGLIGQYAVPVLEDKPVWGTDAPTRIAFMDTQDVARLTLTALRNEKVDRKSLTLAGPRAWTTQEVISLCERLAGQDAKVTTVPVGVLRATRLLTRFFQWSADVSDRLTFSEVLSSDAVFSAPMAETYSLLGVDPKDITTLEAYLQDYYTQILKKLKDLRAQSKQGDFYL